MPPPTLSLPSDKKNSVALGPPSKDNEKIPKDQVPPPFDVKTEPSSLDKSAHTEFPPAPPAPSSHTPQTQSDNSTPLPPPLSRPPLPSQATAHSPTELPNPEKKKNASSPQNQNPQSPPHQDEADPKPPPSATAEPTPPPIAPSPQDLPPKLTQARTPNKLPQGQNHPAPPLLEDSRTTPCTQRGNHPINFSNPLRFLLFR